MKIILRDGQSLFIRSTTSDDKQRVEDFFYRLSPESRRLRFHSPKQRISEREISEIIEINPPERFSYVATMGEGDKEKIVAIGSWGLTPEGAEVGFMVSEDIQVRGVGTALLEQLAIKAVGYNIRSFIAHVLPENSRMMDVFENSGFTVTKKFADGIHYVNLDLMEKVDFLKRRTLREHVSRSAGVRRVIYPKNVAVIGASRNSNRIGGALFQNILSGNFKGTVFPVNPNAPSIGGVHAYPSVIDIPEDVDLAVIIVPADRVLDVVDQCGEKGVKGLVIISAGFGEASEEGKRRERKLWEKVIAYGMRAVGPNSLGILNADPEISLNGTFSPYSPPTGSISIGTQSGALGLALLDHVKNYNLGIAHFVSIGNQMDISSNDLLEFWEDDENTEVILLYLESFGDPRSFSRIARRLTRKKPIVAVKSGRSAVGARAASSHTGALAAFDVAVDAMFKQAGVVRVDTLQEMFNVAEALAYQHLPPGPRVGILTNAGGPGILVADASTAVGLIIPQLST
ncbi:MAG: GNAT family N-acetyltransferase, partial [Deltaproteobacteria bacterium]|nr:GNAT family N-acetyltransferase [Deltaproteobacteria bacterium]